MIIQCDRCSTKFKIDDAKVTEEGIRVKCKKCQHIFSVRRPQETFEELKIDEDLFLSEEGVKEEEEFPQIPQEKEEEDWSWTGALTTEEHPSEEPSMLKKDEEEAEKPTVQKVDDEFLFSFEPQVGEIEPSIEKEETPASGIEEVETQLPESYEMATAEEDDLEDIRMDTDKEAQKVDIYGEQEEYEKDFVEETLTSTTVEPSAFSKKRILIFTLLLLAFVGVGLTLRGNLEQLNRGFLVLFEMIGGKTLDNAPLGLIGLKGYYQPNEKAGMLFVIEGRLVNPSEVARSFTSIKGTIFDKEGKVFEEKIINLGKLLTKEQLSKLSREDIEKSLGGGIDTLPPGKPSPFIVVFYQVPPDLSEFLVEVEE